MLLNKASDFNRQRQANSTLKLVKRYLRTTMTKERLSVLAMMNIYYEKPVNYDAVI